MENRQNKTDIFYRLLLLVIFAILGVLIGFGVGSGISFLSSTGVFSFWKSLDTDSIAPEKILYANSNSVWIENTQGDIYVHQLNCPILNADCKKWSVEEDLNRLRYIEMPPKDNEECVAHVSIRPKAPPSNSIQCVYASRVHTLNDGFTYYSLTGDNEIWYWRTPNNYQKLIIVIFSVLAGLFAGLFFGEDFTARRKGQYKQVLDNFASLFTSMFRFAIAGSLVGLVAGIGIVYFHETGAFISWEPLYSPIKFAQIVNANTRTVWAQSTDGKLYSQNLYCPWEECDFWAETNAIPEDAFLPNEGVNIGNTCNFESGDVVEGNIKPKKQPGSVVECALARGAMYESSWTVYYVLLNDGTIWIWRYTSDMFYFIYVPFISVLIGTLLGTIVGIVAFIVKMRRSKQIALPNSLQV